MSARYIIVGLLLALGTWVLFPGSVFAAGSCTASVSPASVQANSSTNFNFSISNTGSAAINFIKIVAPSANFTLHNYGVAGWSIGANNSLAELTGGSINSGDSFNFSYNATTGSSEAGSANWQVMTSDGSGIVDCTGSLGTAISGVADITAPEITDVIITGIYATQATVTWNTNESANSKIDYGIASDTYSAQKTDSTLSTSHSLLLDGLTANTTYYFFLTSSDAAGNTSVTDEASFATAAPDAGVATTVTVTVNTTTTTTNTVTNTVTKIVEVKDTAPPNLSLATNFKKVYAVAPEITGQATDPSGVSLVEYTLDAGKNWLPVDNIAKRFAKSSAFSFLPENLLDGNYPLKVRVTDGAGNIGFSPAYTLIIDRLPPSVGLGLWSFGPQILESTVVEGMTARVALSAVGGPTEIILCIKYQAICEETKLTKNEETGLWMADVKFSVDGDYGLAVRSVDGADNRTEGELGVVRVLPSGVVEPPGTVTVYYYEPSWGRFQIWDGQAFGQSNPVKTPDSGKYFLLLPPGKYYLEAGSPNFRTARTGIFTLPKTSVVNMHFVLLPKLNWWPWDQIDEVVWVSADDSPITNSTNPALPFFALPDTADKLVYNSSLRGVPTVLTFLASWTPTVSEQVTELEKVASNKNYKAMVVFAQEPLSLAKIFQKRGDYKLTMVADPDGELLKPLGVASVPTHVFIDRKGLITKVIKGVLSSEEIISNF